MGSTFSWLFLSLLVTESGGTGEVLPAPVAAPGSPVTTGFPWQTWWERNLPLLVTKPAPADDDVCSVEGSLGRRQRVSGRSIDDLAEALSEPGEKNLLELLDAVRLQGRAGIAAVLALGPVPGGEAIGHLKCLMENRPSGRHLAGDASQPVPGILRAGAALALGLSRHLRGFQALRTVLLDPEVPDAVGAAAIIGLTISDSMTDTERFASHLRDAVRRPLMAEAAAAAIGRHVRGSTAGDAALLRALASDVPEASRGAAAGLWFPDRAPGEATERALQRAISLSTDPVTRALALLALAGRGSPRAAIAIDQALLWGPDWKGYAALALGILGWAEPKAREGALVRLQDLAGEEPEAVLVASHLLQSQRGPGPPVRVRSAPGLAAGNSCFRGSVDLQVLLDAVKELSR